MFSVIIPAYNPDIEMLKECLDSLLSYEGSIEVIIIDDGSDLNVGNQLNKLSKSDSRIQLFHKENEGVSVARNVGIGLASGDWVLFVDADDWISDGALYKLNELCSASEADMIFSGHIRNYPDKEVSIHCSTYKDGDIVYEWKEKVELLKKTVAASEYGEVGARATCFRAVWSVLFRRKFLVDNHIYFPVGVPIGEDLIFRLYAEFAAKRILYIDDCFYHYRNNTASVSVKYRRNAVDDSMNELSHIRQFIMEKGLSEELNEAFKLRVVEVMTVLPKRCFFHKDNPDHLSERRRKATEFYHSDFIKGNISKDILRKLPLKRKAQAFLLRHKLYNLYMIIISITGN